jgi:hypothetical protein
MAITIAAQMAVVEALSAFDSFSLDLATNLAQFSIQARTKGPFKHAHTSVICDHSHPAEFCVCCYACAIQYGDNHRFATRIEDLCADLNITDVAVNELLPMFHYFRLARNSIVHANGRASEEFSDYDQTPELGISVGYWNKVTRKTAPDLPKPALGASISFTMAHAILASAVCYRIAQSLNRHAVQLLGIDGMVHMAAFFSLFAAQHEFRRSVHLKAEAAPSNFLANRYRVRRVVNHEIIQIAKRLNLWKDILQRAKAIYPQIKS